MASRLIVAENRRALLKLVADGKLPLQSHQWTSAETAAAVEYTCRLCGGKVHVTGDMSPSKVGKRLDPAECLGFPIDMETPGAAERALRQNQTASKSQ